MIPLTIAEEIRATLLDYLTTTFSFQDQAVEQALLDFFSPIDNKQNGGGLFKGPYITVRLPFRKAGPETQVPLEIQPNFLPYAHQLRAFERLSARDGHQPQSTLITTGTGSGKTECFLYPLLDYCYAHRGETGIKAIILYPMNALATDQAGRLARLLWTDNRLKGQVTAGIYIGGEGEISHSTMGLDHLIDDRDTMRKTPPDILLTNYRMLDFLLLRPEDKTLWADNTPETLRFLVLDELHTYDGAQGSDVACLIRRLKARLGTPPEMLCAVGTSATVSSDLGNTRNLLVDYAQEIFDVPFSQDSVIVEDRLNLHEFIPEAAKYDSYPQDLSAPLEINGEGYEDYIERQCLNWFEEVLDPVDLSTRIREHSFLVAILTQLGGSILSLDELIERLERWDPTFADFQRTSQALILQSFLSLVSHARILEGSEQRPFLTCQVQLWVREISRLMREVCYQPAFFWRYDIPLSSDRRGLPAYFCRECGHTGWLTMMHDGDDYIIDDLKLVYAAYFSHTKHVRYMYPTLPTEPLDDDHDHVCPSCLTVSSDEFCQACKKETLKVRLYIDLSTPHAANQQPHDTQRCPLCGTDGALSIVGSQAASLSSVAISHLYTTPLNQDKKLLAFTDSVQDASHRASFFEARTFRFSLRTAIQSTLEGNQPVRLDELTEKVLHHWRNRWANRRNSAARLVATFVPPDLQEIPGYDEYMDAAQHAEEEGGQPVSVPRELEQNLLRRLSWEVTMEYGFTARVGRSLERVGSSVAYLDPAVIEQAVSDLMLILPNEIGSLAELKRTALIYFLLGLLDRTRIRGGVVHPLLNSYAIDQGNWYLLTKKVQPLLSPFHKNSPRFPRFLTDTPERDVFDLFITSGTRKTWFVDWAQKVFGQQMAVSDINDLYNIVVSQLSHKGLLQRFSHGSSNAYGIESKNLLVTHQTVILKCNRCGHLQTIAANELNHWEGQACLSFRCNGAYSQQIYPGQHYYREVYQRGQVERIFAHEHTGLLRRETRERVEREFRLHPRADATNLLTATPTLELGIDIGDLSATMACSVPPAPANYLQRIGRAGRKTGNSLILTLANAQPHDLYFFEEPIEMMAGVITPPGCFLDAPDMLKRQFLAFCMDTWTGFDPRITPLPRDVQKMLAGIKKGGFPENLLKFIHERQEELIDRFMGIFGPLMSPENQRRLREYCTGGRLFEEVREAVSEKEKEREELRSARKSLKLRRDKVEADPAQYQNPEVELRRLDQDMSLLLDMIKQLEDQYILAFFTDAGLLPNYAFPETGIRLTGVISDQTLDPYRGKDYILKEYVRAAPLAIRELAPFNHFYAEGYKLTISHVDIAGRENAVERWQFCDQCSYMELVAAHHFHKTCPSCGSTMWSDGGQQHDMVRFRKANAYVEKSASRVGDDGDDRDRTSYHVHHYFNFGPENSQGAHLLPNLPFGIEYLDQVTLREINFGPVGALGRQISINAEDCPQNGFHTCRDCGVTVENPNSPQTTTKHTRNCAAGASSGQIQWENIYLYREMTSEALRILLPVSTTQIEEKMATFEACLDLGLRKKFQGNPDHLHILTHTEPAEDGSRRRYLIVYDSVPGGTGFLKDLARPEHFFDVLQLALDSLVSCRCRLQPEKQACYRCLYSYRFQRELKLISRKLGIEMLSEILGQRTSLTVVKSLSQIHMEGLLESELEQRFVNALDSYVKRKPNHSFSQIIWNGKPSWDLILETNHWVVEPQVLLGPEKGVREMSRADFVFWPQRDSQGKPIAVFTDGFTFHVRPGQSAGGLSDDICKRKAIIDSQNFHVWSIMWDDVIQFEKKEPHPFQFFTPEQNRFANQFIASEKYPLPDNLSRLNAMDQLFVYLNFPDHSSWIQIASALALAALRPTRPPVNGNVIVEKTKALRQEILSPDLSIPDGSPSGDHFYSIITRTNNTLLVYVSQSALQNKQFEKITLTLRLHDHLAERSQISFRLDWQQFWLFVNLFQFLPDFEPISDEYIQVYIMQALEEMAPIAPPEMDWEPVFLYASAEVHNLLKSCQNLLIASPTVGFELQDTQSEVIASSELAWENEQIAVLLPDQIGNQDAFIKAGWKVFDPTRQSEIIQALQQGG